jgi:hypothetical protein
MGLFDLVFDELSKEIKEAPGWLSLVFVCNLVLLVRVISEKLARLDISREETTIATLVAFVLFFLGDLLDSIFFPRERDGKRFERILKSLMLLLGAFAVFFFLQRVWLWAAGLTLLWILIIPIYNTRKHPFWSALKLWTEKGIPQKEVTETNESDNEMTGFKGLVVQYDRMAKSKDEVGKELHIRRGMYRVSMALARKSESYTMSIWIPNEAAKFIRSAVFPSLAAGVWLLVGGRNYGAALLILASPALLMLSCSLKGLHIRRLYDLGLEIMKNNAKYSSFKPRLGVRLFLFGDDIVDHASGSSLAER